MSVLTTPLTAVAALNGADEELWRGAAEILDRNWSYDHTVPSRTLYPHHWSWDSAFNSIGLAQTRPDRAWRDLRSLFEGQWFDGRVPHIVFDARVPANCYFPGPDFWAEVPAPDRPGVATSGLVQPPVHALAAWQVFRRTPNEAAVEELRWLYPRLVAQQEYLTRFRDVGGAGLAAILHPWESGLDNSPGWDEALGDVTVGTEILRPNVRRDKQVAAEDHRPTDQDYARYIFLAASYRDGACQDADLLRKHPFLVECPSFNALRAVAELALARIARVVGADSAPHRARASAIMQVLLDRLYDPATGMFHTLNVRTGQLSPERCVNGLIPLMLPLPASRVAPLVAVIQSPRFGLTEQMPVPSFDRMSEKFDVQRYWRGPVWINANWLLWRGLRAHGYGQLAATLRTAMLNLVRRSGFFEYFRPDTGEGIGAPAFSWTAALTLDLLSDC